MTQTAQLTPADGSPAVEDGDGQPPHVRVAIVGGGLAGIAMAIKLREAGVEDFVILERAGEIGGTWQANTYPGCQCDVPSHLYSYSFEPNPSWTRTYSRQAEIWAYVRRCAERHGVRDRVRLGHELTAATWDEQSSRWRVETSCGELTATLLVDASGPLSQPALPKIRGLRRFEGKLFHSAEWDHEHKLDGERVAVIGTGASAIQFVPRIQPRVDRLLVFQRTAPWIMPHSDRPTTRAERLLYRLLPPVQRAVRTAIYWSRESLVLGFAKRPALTRPAERIARLHLRHQVADRALRQRLEPDFRLGCKRVLLSNDWYPALTRPNVELVTDAISHIDGREIVLADGSRHEVDTIILGTGFSVQEPPTSQIVRGSDGVTLAESAAAGPLAYLGTALAGFPNYFRICGPNTGLGHSSMIFMIESQVAYIVDAIRAMDERGVGRVEVRREAVARYGAELEAMMPRTVWATGCSSWYLDETGRNTTLWPDFTFRFRRRTRHFDAGAYELRVAAPPAAVAVS